MVQANGVQAFFAFANMGVTAASKTGTGIGSGPGMPKTEQSTTDQWRELIP